MQGDPAARGRGSGRDADQFAPDRSRGRLGQSGPGDRRRCAGEIERDDGQHQPGGVGVELARGKMRQRAALQIGVDLLDHGMSPMRLVGGDGVQITGGEERVEPVGVEQRRLLDVLRIQFRDDIS